MTSKEADNFTETCSHCCVLQNDGNQPVNLPELDPLAAAQRHAQPQKLHQSKNSVR